MFNYPFVSETGTADYSNTSQIEADHDVTHETTRPAQRPAANAGGYWSITKGGKVRWISYETGQLTRPPAGSEATIAEIRSYLPDLEPGWKLWQGGSWFKDLMVTLAYTWSGYATGQFAGTILEGGIPALGSAGESSLASGPQPLWEGLGSTKWTSLLEIGLGGVGEIFSFDYMGGDNASFTESAWWGGFGSSLLTRGLRLYDLSPSWSDMAAEGLKNAGETVVETVVGAASDPLPLHRRVVESAWDKLNEGTDWEWFMDIYN